MDVNRLIKHKKLPLKVLTYFVTLGWHIMPKNTMRLAALEWY